MKTLQHILALTLTIAVSISANLGAVSRLSTASRSLLSATKVGNTPQARAALARGANIEARDQIYGANALHYAIVGGFTNIVKTLIDTIITAYQDPQEAGDAVHAYVNTFSRGLIGNHHNQYAAQNITTLHYAALYNRPEIAHILIMHGANVNAIDGAGNTPADLAYQNGHSAIIELIQSYTNIE